MDLCFVMAGSVLMFVGCAPGPTLPADSPHGGLPAQFGAALQAAREKVRAGGFDTEDVRGLAHLYQANRLNDEARLCYGILQKQAKGLTARDHYYLADMDAYEGDLDGAEVELRTVVKMDPEYLAAHLTLGDVLFKSGKVGDAATEYGEILTMVPNQPQAMFGMARIELLAGQDDKAVSRLVTLMGAHPEMTSGAGLLAQVFDRRGDAARAATMRKWSMQKTEPVPKDPWMDALLADCYDLERLGLKFEEYFSSGEIAQAVPLLRRVEELDPKSPIPQLLRGWTFAEDHDDTDAVVEYGKALEKGGDPEKICPYMVKSLMALGRYSDAEALMARYYEKKPDSIPILIAYSDVALQRPDKELARTLLEKVLEKEPYLVSANMSLASILWASGDHDGAAKCLERVVQVSTSDMASRALLGQYYIERNDPLPAIAPLEQALSLAHDDGPARANITRMLFAAYIGTGSGEEERGQVADAVTNYYDKAILLIPTNPNGYARKARACAQLGRYGDAAAALEQLESLQPANPTIYLSHGDILYMGGDKVKARVYWQKARDLVRPGDVNLRSAIDTRLEGPITEATFK